MSKDDYFRRYDTPPSRVHKELQTLAREAGWTPPWEQREEQQQREKQEQQRQKEEEQHQRQKKAAGKKSGVTRRSRAELRLSIIRAAYVKLNPTYKHKPFSNDSIWALRKEYLSLLGCYGVGPQPPTDDPVTDDPETDDPVTDEELDLLNWTVEKLSGTQVTVSEDKIRALRDACLRVASPSPSLTDEEFDVLYPVVIAILALSGIEREALQEVSNETLRKGLMQLRVKGSHRAQRSG